MRVGTALCHVWTAPGWQGESSRRRAWSVQPCVRRDGGHLGRPPRQQRREPGPMLSAKELGIAVINAIRAHLAELGIVAPVGRNGVEALLNIVADTSDNRIPEIARVCLVALGAQLRALKAQILDFDRLIMALNHPVSYARQNPEFRFLPLRWTAALRGSSCQYRVVPVQDSSLARSGSEDPPEFHFLPLRWTATLRVRRASTDSCWDETERSSLQRTPRER